MALDKVRLNGVLNGRVNAMGINGGSGGGGMTLLTATNDQRGGVTLNATYNQVKQALQSGQLVGFYMDDRGLYELYLAFAYWDADDTEHAGVTFTCAAGLNNSPRDFEADSEDGELYYLQQH